MILTSKTNPTHYALRDVVLEMLNASTDQNQGLWVIATVLAALIKVMYRKGILNDAEIAEIFPGYAVVRK